MWQNNVLNTCVCSFQIIRLLVKIDTQGLQEDVWLSIMTRHISRPAENEGMTKLMVAVSECRKSVVKNLIAAGDDLHTRDKHGRNVLYHAFASSEMTEGMIITQLHPSVFMSLCIVTSFTDGHY